MRTQVPKFLQEDLMSVWFGFECGMHALCGTRGHFPTEESIYFKARRPQSYYCSHSYEILPHWSGERKNYYQE